jgi:hypothetical protein
MVLCFGNAIERVLDLRELAAPLRVETVENRIVFFFDHGFFTVLIESLTVAADMPLDAADTREQILTQFFQSGLGGYGIHD